MPVPDAPALLTTIVVSAALGCGLMAGLFFVFSISVMKSLASLPAACGVAAMQAINVTIVRPLFLLAFVGTAAACAYLLVGAVLGWHPADGWLVAGAGLYLVGTFGVTAAANVPLNNALAPLDAHGPEAAAFWPEYVARWTRWNHVRTVAALGATLSLTLALVP